MGVAEEPAAVQDSGRVVPEAGDPAGKWLPGPRASAVKAWIAWAGECADLKGGTWLGLFTGAYIVMGLVAFASSLIGHPVDLPAGFVSGYCTTAGGFGLYGATKAWRTAPPGGLP